MVHTLFETCALPGECRKSLRSQKAVLVTDEVDTAGLPGGKPPE